MRRSSVVTLSSIDQDVKMLVIILLLIVCHVTSEPVNQANQIEQKFLSLPSINSDLIHHEGKRSIIDQYIDETSDEESVERYDLPEDEHVIRKRNIFSIIVEGWSLLSFVKKVVLFVLNVFTILNRAVALIFSIVAQIFILV